MRQGTPTDQPWRPAARFGDGLFLGPCLKGSGYFCGIFAVFFPVFLQEYRKYRKYRIRRFSKRYSCIWYFFGIFRYFSGIWYLNTKYRPFWEVGGIWYFRYFPSRRDTGMDPHLVHSWRVRTCLTHATAKCDRLPRSSSGSPRHRRYLIIAPLITCSTLYCGSQASTQHRICLATSRRAR